MSILYSLPPLIQATVTKRPSALIKSPYVADVILSNNTNSLAHSLSLGCKGLCDKDATVFLTELHSNHKDNKPHCKHTIQFAYQDNVLIGVNPKLAEHIIHNALKNNLLPFLNNLLHIKREVSVFINEHVDSRFDFGGYTHDGVPFLLEVKNVPLAFHINAVPKDKKNFVPPPDADPMKKIAVFPDGHKKHINDPVSPRALKHIRELTYLKLNTSARCILCFVVQRHDAATFELSATDPEYADAVRCAISVGVEVYAIFIRWSLEGHAYLHNILSVQ